MKSDKKHIEECLKVRKEKIATKRAKAVGEILELYMRGETQKNIAKIMGMTTQVVGNYLRSFKKDYLATLSVRGVVPPFKHLDEPIEKINEAYGKMLSRSDQPLTDNEMLYCALFVSTGDSIQALTDAKMDVGLDTEDKAITVEIRDVNLLLRSEGLKRKKNVQAEIRRLQLDRLEMREVNRDRVLEMHMSLIEQLTEQGDPKNKSLIVKLLDQVNKMNGFYSMTINKGEVSADDVLDGQMLIMKSELPEELKEEQEESYD